GKVNFLLDTNHILFEKKETEFAVSKFSIFKKDVTLSIQFLKSNGNLDGFFTKANKHVLLQKRSIQTEVLLRRFLSIAFCKDEVFKEQTLIDLINQATYSNSQS